MFICNFICHVISYANKLTILAHSDSTTATYIVPKSLKRRETESTPDAFAYVRSVKLGLYME